MDSWVFLGSSADPWRSLGFFGAAPALMRSMYFLHHIMVHKHDSLWLKKEGDGILVHDGISALNLSGVTFFLFCFGNGHVFLPPDVSKAAQSKSVFSLFYSRKSVKRRLMNFLPLRKFGVS